MSFFGTSHFGSDSNNTINCHFDSKQEKDLFSKWAFGSDAKSVELKDIPYLWNMKHPDLFRIDTTNQLYRSINKMIQTWKERKPE